MVTVADELAKLPGMSRNERVRRKAQLEAEIAARGVTIRYVELCEDSETPGMPGYYGGVTSHKRREVKIATKKLTPLGVADRDIREIIAVLTHELRHVTDPSWDCGNRML